MVWKLVQVNHLRRDRSMSAKFSHHPLQIQSMLLVILAAFLSTLAVCHAEEVTSIDADLSATITRGDEVLSDMATHNDGDEFPTVAERELDESSEEGSSLMAISRSRVDSNERSDSRASLTVKSFAYIIEGLESAEESLDVVSGLSLVRNFTESRSAVVLQRALHFNGNISLLNNAAFSSEDSFEGLLAQLDILIRTGNTVLVDGTLALQGTSSGVDIISSGDLGTSVAASLPDSSDPQFKEISFDGDEITYLIPGTFPKSFDLTIDVTATVSVPDSFQGAEVIFGLNEEPMLAQQRQDIPEPTTALLILTGVATLFARRYP